INMFENSSLDDEKINLTLNNEDVFDPFSFMNNKNIDIEMKDIEMKDNISESSYQNPTSPSYYDNPKHSKTLVEDNQVLTSPNMKFNFDKIEDINNIEDNDNNNDYQIPTSPNMNKLSQDFDNLSLTYSEPVNIIIKKENPIKYNSHSAWVFDAALNIMKLDNELYADVDINNHNCKDYEMLTDYLDLVCKVCGSILDESLFVASKEQMEKVKEDKNNFNTQEWIQMKILYKWQHNKLIYIDTFFKAIEELDENNKFNPLLDDIYLKIIERVPEHEFTWNDVYNAYKEEGYGGSSNIIHKDRWMAFGRVIRLQKFLPEEIHFYYLVKIYLELYFTHEKRICKLYELDTDNLRLNNSYVLYKLLQMHGVDTRWVPLKRSVKVIEKMDEKWIYVCKYFSWKYMPVYNTPINVCWYKNAIISYYKARLNNEKCIGKESYYYIPNENRLYLNEDEYKDWDFNPCFPKLKLTEEENQWFNRINRIPYQILNEPKISQKLHRLMKNKQNPPTSSKPFKITNDFQIVNDRQLDLFNKYYKHKLYFKYITFRINKLPKKLMIEKYLEWCPN